MIFTAALFLFQGTTLHAQSDTDYADRPPRQCRRCHDDIYEEYGLICCMRWGMNPTVFRRSGNGRALTTTV